MNAATKYVASRGRPELTWERSIVLTPDPVTAIRALKQEDGPELQVHGSGDLLQTLVGSDLVDEYRVLVFPVLVGAGKRLFGEGTAPRGLRLLESTRCRLSFLRADVHWRPPRCTPRARRSTIC